MDSLTRQIAERLSSARKAANLSQDDLAEALGINDRQTVSAMETGVREISGEELATIAKILERSIDYFIDPYLVAEEEAFSYRAREVNEPAADSFESQAMRLISVQRRFRELLGETPSPVQPQLSGLFKSNPAEFATFQGEQSAKAWNLGPVPGARLLEAAENELRITVLFIDAPRGISGAACRLADGGFVLINRREPLARRNYDLGYELFHLLTWDRMPPEKHDLEERANKSKTEMLADAYTAGLLMPSWIVDERWSTRGEESIASWIWRNSRELLVSWEALYWRIVNIGHVNKADHPVSAVQRLVFRLRADAAPDADVIPPLYSHSYVSRLQRVLNGGHLTVLKAADLLDTDPTGLRELFEAHGLPAPFDI